MVSFESDPAERHSVVSGSFRRMGPSPRGNGLTETAAGHCFRIACMKPPGKGKAN